MLTSSFSASSLRPTVIGSALCGASQSMNMLIGARAIQGIGGGCILSLTQLILSDIVPLEKRGVSVASFVGRESGLCVKKG